MGIPVIMSNKVGRLVTNVPARFPPQDSEFPGYSAIADSNGTLIGQLGSGKEGVVVGIIARAPELRRRTQVQRKKRATLEFDRSSIKWE